MSNVITVKEFKELWDTKTDEERIILLQKNPLKYTINVDNDSVFVSFENNESICYFDEFGYHLLVVLFNTFDINAEMV